MSQLYYAESGTPLANVETLTGNTGGVVGPDSFGNILFRGKDSAYVTGTPGSNLLEIRGSATYLVDAGGKAPYTTLTAAVAAAIAAGVSASAPAYIVLKAGIYPLETPSVTAPGITIIGYDRYASERGLSTNSAVRVPSVRIQGTISGSADCNVVGVGIVPADGSPAIDITATSNWRVVDCKIEMTNAGMFDVDGGPTIVCSRCVGIDTTASVTDSLITTGSGSSVSFYADGCNFDFNAGITVPGNYHFYNSYAAIFYTYASSASIGFVIRNSDIYSGTVHAFVVGGASNVIQIETTNSSLRSDAANLVDFTGATSYVHAQNCYLRGDLTTGTATDNILISCARWAAAISSWVPTSTAFGNAVFDVLQNTGSASVQAQRLTVTAGGDPSTLWSISGTRGYCQGIDNSDSDKLKLTATNSSSLSPSSGSTIWSLDPTNSNATTWTAPTIICGGFVPTATSTTPYVVALSECYIAMNSTAAAKTVQLPDAPPIGSVYFVKDSHGQSATNNITVTTPGGLTNFDAVFSDTINSAYVERKYTYVSAGLGYMIG